MVILSDLAENDSDLAGGEEKLVNASAGLTRSQVEQLGSWCLANEGRIDSASLMRLKIAQLKESGVCQISLPEAGFESLGGSQNAKDFCLRLLAGKGKQPAKGILALGVPGTGKTAFARALAKETGRALIVANIGNLKGSLQGQTENNLRQLLQVADQLGSDGAKAILFFDEIEKGLAGVESSSRTDGGVMMNVYGELLKWLNDHTSDVFVIGTCNNVGALASESGGAFLRSGRFDGKLFWDFPTQEERASIWTIHKAGYGIQDETPADDGWTGADIEQACRLADTLQVPLSEAAKLVRPLSRQSLDPVRRWAEAEGCISASYRGLFRSAGAPALDTTSRRKVAKAN
jgi:SpoVK/Ycf46/Vps4 family AAA+-type ATPase